MTTSVNRSIRLIPKTPSELARLTGSTGEIFLDSQDLTLRIFNGHSSGGISLLRADLSNLETSGGQIDFNSIPLVAQSFTGPLFGDVTGNVTGDLTGNVTGDVIGNVTGDVTGNVTGDVTGNLTGNVTGNLTGNVTGDLTGLAASASKCETARTIRLAGDLSGSVTLDGTSDVTLNATVSTNTVTLGTDTVGNYIAAGAVSGNGLSGSVNAEGGTFTVTSNATAPNTPSTIVFRDSTGNFSANTITAALSGNVTGNLTGNVTGNVNGNVTGNVTGNLAGNVTSTGTSTFATATVQNMTATNNIVADAVPTAPSHVVNKRYADNLLTAFTIAFGS